MTVFIDPVPVAKIYFLWIKGKSRALWTSFRNFNYMIWHFFHGKMATYIQANATGSFIRERGIEEQLASKCKVDNKSCPESKFIKFYFHVY